MAKRAVASRKEVVDSTDYHRLVDSVYCIAIFALDLNGFVLTWNPGAEHIKGYAADEIVGSHFSIFYTDEDKDAGRPQRMLAAAKAQGFITTEGWRVAKGGRRFWARVTISTMTDATGEVIGFSKITIDMTESRETRLKLERTREELHQSQKMEAVGKLTGGIAHDFNNLLQIISGCLEMLEPGLVEDDRRLKFVSTAQAVVVRASGLIQHLLAFSRQKVLRPEVIDVAEKINAAAAFLQAALHGEVTPILYLSTDLWPVRVDVQELELAIYNIGINARDAMEKGGTLLLAAKNVLLDDKHLGLKGKFVCLSFTDSGIGIPQEMIPHVIEPYFTTKPIGKGSGLGLSQVYGFASEAGGGLQIESEPGKGTTIMIYLPAVQEMMAAPADLPSLNSPLGGQTYSGRILLVEDDAVIGLMTSSGLEEMGFTVLNMPNADAALRELDAREGTGFDLVFSDIRMAGDIDGLELAVEIRRRWPDLPIVLTTGYTPSRAIGDFLVIPKPYMLSSLGATLAREMRKHAPADHH